MELPMLTETAEPAPNPQAPGAPIDDDKTLSETREAIQNKTRIIFAGTDM
jgi:hypothetical protein